ncbi:Hypothetical predicted protein [Podarcis lilfordi]|uniref:Uncharacterized protein n=1 Tax=Podarcis lilfordi TaxID=74358 RepID=A0AA35K7I5_9SAUR|nr:Hypothetical predicted protein [Podarcis lilfordi]
MKATYISLLSLCSATTSLHYNLIEPVRRDVLDDERSTDGQIRERKELTNKKLEKYRIYFCVFI